MLTDANILKSFCRILLRLYSRNKFISDVISSKKNFKRISDDKKRLKFNNDSILKHSYKEAVARARRHARTRARAYTHTSHIHSRWNHLHKNIFRADSIRYTRSPEDLCRTSTDSECRGVAANYVQNLTAARLSACEAD